MDEMAEIEGPVNFLPDLSLWGIEEVDRGTCMDTAENRKIIRENKARYQPVFTSSGEPTDYIQVITTEMREAITRTNRIHILSDIHDHNSDYLSGLDLLLADAEDHVPAWVLAATREWKRVSKRREVESRYRPHLIGPPARCAAYKIDGNRCMNWTNGSMTYGDFCKAHSTNRPNAEQIALSARAKARYRIESAAVMAAEILEDLAQNATSEPVRADAAKQLLSIAGIRPGMEIEVKGEVEVKPARDEIAQRLAQLRDAAIAEASKRAELEQPEPEILDAEVVEHD